MSEDLNHRYECQNDDCYEYDPETDWRGEHYCLSCGHVQGNTAEPAYEEGRGPDLGGPGTAPLGRAQPGFPAMDRRLARLNDQRIERIPTVKLAEQAIRRSPFATPTQNQALTLVRRTSPDFFRYSRADTGIESYGMGDDTTNDDKRARAEYRANHMAWGAMKVIDDISPIGWREMARRAGISTSKAELFARDLSASLGYQDEFDVWVRISVHEALGIKVSNQDLALNREIQRLAIWCGNSGLEHWELGDVRTLSWKLLDSWGVTVYDLALCPLSNKSPALQAEVAVTMALLKLGHPPSLVRALQNEHPKPGSVAIRSGILSGTYSPAPEPNPSSINDDLSSHGGWEE